MVIFGHFWTPKIHQKMVILDPYFDTYLVIPRKNTLFSWYLDMVKYAVVGWYPQCICYKYVCIWWKQGVFSGYFYVFTVCTHNCTSNIALLIRNSALPNPNSAHPTTLHLPRRPIQHSPIPILHIPQHTIAWCAFYRYFVSS